MKRRELRIYGTPAPQGSKRAFGNRLVEVSKKVKPWKASIQRAAELAPMDTLDGELSVRITFLMPRPLAHYGTGKNKDVLRETAPKWHSHAPDVDKLARATLDGLTQAGVIADDKYVCILHAQKKYADRDITPGAIIIIEEVPCGR